MKNEPELQLQCQEMVQRITEQTEVFPKPYPGYGFWHLHLFNPSNFIDAPTTPHDVRQLCVQTLINRAHHLTTLAPSNGEPTRVVVAIGLPKLAQSQIIVFFGDEYFGSFFTRDRPGQTWTPLEEKCSLVQEWALQIPPNFSERGYLQEIREPDFTTIQEIWFIGQLATFVELNRST